MQNKENVKIFKFDTCCSKHPDVIHSFYRNKHIIEACHNQRVTLVGCKKESLFGSYVVEYVLEERKN